MRVAATPSKLRLTRPEVSESDLLASIQARLAWDKNVVWHGRFNSGAQMVGKRWIQFNRMPEGLACPDILGQLWDGRLLAIEVKRPSGRIRPGQAEFIELAASKGAVAAIVRSMNDLEALLAEAKTSNNQVFEMQ